VTRFAARWWRNGVVNVVLDVVALAGVGLALFDLRWGFLVAVAQIGPIGLSVKGVTSPLAWTGRLRRLAAVTGVLFLVLYLLGAILVQPLLIVIPLFLSYLVVDLALWALGPLERRSGRQWVDRAAAKLTSVGPDVVAITGSYGKTTTKNYVAHLLSGSRRVVASPASFNNRMGLARAINENLAPGTEVFVAEMGTYGPGEIADLCAWIPPKVAAMVAIGPVHLERFRTLENIVRSKAEILDRAEVGVICVDHPLLADLARERASSIEIVEVSARDGVVVAGERVAETPQGVFGANLAVALGICQALGVDVSGVASRIADLPTAEHRQSVSTAAAGFTIVDDTFNSNPDGARSALSTLQASVSGGKTAVITPGMVELGPVQAEENRAFAEEAASRVDHLVIVGRTNRDALRRGSANGRASVTVVDSRDEAVAWAREHLGPGDAVLYENDLPDHYP
ncbi:MAG TPA: UDP-N-acetylmuramoyl-tripeptide--D-alanyl-D-alanine ligase, partial [Acidimicrobiia bacterium]|nr:UDP-N-acetylmuramoyl-tripeptide--D-alanyl-D-alanine ligase [Acidimicrobiia bacterium]